ncbi:hypothetical protein KVV02_004653 [Mortierella alpina]|uniref:Symplekin n=1 Tax=Mortierella alpina TaxID=64518 RepID=A0A9P7ZZT9_MORAP|nr:hypothetical protein KVV02_004653 [Mortierella alpina]
MAAHDIQLALHAHLNNASLAPNHHDLKRHLDDFSRDWKKEPTLNQFDASLRLLRESRGGPNSEIVSLWWAGYIQDAVLNDHTATLSPEFNQALLRAADPLTELVASPSATIIKRALQVCASIFPKVFRICCQDSASHVSLWNEYAIKMKHAVLRHKDGTNEGITLSLCKYLQIIIQIQSHSQPNSIPQETEVPSLNGIPPNHPFLNTAALLQESDHLLRELLSVIQRPMVSSTIITAIINQTSALQRARPQYIPLIIRTWLQFVKPAPPAHLSPLQTKFIEKSIRIQLLAISKMQLQPLQAQALTEALSAYGIRFNGGSLSRSQQQQLLHVDRENGDDSRKSSKRARPSNQDLDDNDLKRPKAEPDIRSSNTPPQPGPGPSTAIPPGFGQTLLGQINITQLPVHHVVDIILETLTSNNVPHLFHSFLSTLPVMRLKEGPLPMPPPGVGPPPPGLLHNRPPPMLPGMAPPFPGGPFPPPHFLPHLGPPGQLPMPGPPPVGAPDARPEIKQEPKKEINISKLQLPRIPENVRVNINVLAPKHTPTHLPTRPIVAKSDAVTIGFVPRQKDGEASGKDVKEEPKKESEEVQQQLKQETFQAKPFEPTADRPSADAALAPARKLLEEAFERIVASENLISVPGATGRKMLDAAAILTEHSAAQEAENSTVPFDAAGTAQQASKVVTKADWMAIVSRLLTRAFPLDSSEGGESSSRAMKESMVNYICEDFKQRRELALTWLHEEWYYDGMCRRQTEGMDEREPQYLWCLYKILDGITSGATQLDAKDRGLTRFLLEVPELPDGAVDVIQKYCDDPARAQVGITCLRDVVNLRPPSRLRALQILLDYTAHPEKLQRSMAIVTAKKWYLEHPTVGPKVEEYALMQLETLKTYPVPKRDAASSQAGPSAVSVLDTSAAESSMEGVTSTKAESTTEREIKAEVKDEPMDNVHVKEASVDPMSSSSLSASAAAIEQAIIHADEDIGRLLELYFSLCAKNHSLLEVLFASYSSLDPFVQRVIRQRILPLVKSIKSDSVKLLALIRSFPAGAEMLVLRIIHIQTDGVRPSPGLVSAVQEAVVLHDLNARFLVPIISGLTKREVLQCLPRIVSLLKGTERERRTVTDVFMKLLKGTGGSGAGQTPAVSLPASTNRRNSVTGGVAGAIGPANAAGPLSTHQQPSTPAQGPILSPSELLIELHTMEDTVGWKSACEAMDICFNHPEIYKSEIVAVVLQQLLDQATLPSLFMRTVIQAITLYKNLIGFVNSMILARLVHKHVWDRPVLWKGFVRCAKMMAPTSGSVLASLPKPQLKEVLTMEPSLKESVDAYIKAKSSGRRVGGGAAKQINMQNIAATTMAQPAEAAAAAVVAGQGDVDTSDAIKKEAEDEGQPPQPEAEMAIDIKTEEVLADGPLTE